MSFVGETEQLTLRAKTELVESLKKISKNFEFSTHNKLALFLLEESLSLLTTPSSCPPLSAEFINLRNKLHGKNSGTYADEPPQQAKINLREGVPSTPRGFTLSENIERDSILMKLIEQLADAKAENKFLKNKHHEDSSKKYPVSQTA